MKRILCFLLMLPTAFLQAQQKSSLSGVVLSENGNPIARATVSLLNADRMTQTDSAGKFVFAALPSGNYQVQVTTIGFASATVPMHTDEPVNKRIVLKPRIRQLDAVVVTAEKQEEALQRLPLSVTALDAEQVKEYRLWNIDQLSAIVPNLYAANPGDKRNVVSIRGLATTSYDQAVATYVDGVNQFGLDTYISPLMDIERIEVLRGPQGTLYGRNAMAGVINIITKKPTNDVSGFVDVSIGNHGLERYTAGVRAPLIKNKLFIGAAGLYERFNGFYTNEFTHSAYDRQHSTMGNYYLKFLPNNRWSITLNAKHNQNRNNGAFPLAYGVQAAFQKPYVLNQNALTTLVDNIFNSSLSARYTGRAFNLVSQTAYQSDYRYYTEPIDADFSPLDGISIFNNYGKDWNHVKVVTEELRISSPATAQRLTWTAGTYLFYQHNPVKQATRFGSDAPLLGMQDKNFSLINTTNGVNKGIAFFGEVSYPLSSKLLLTAGARYDNEKTKQTVLGEYQHDPNPAPVYAFRSDTAATASFAAFSPKVSLAFYPSDKTTWFITYSKGYRTGGLTPLSSDPSQPSLYPFKPEYSNNFEVGMKNNFLQNRLRLNVAAFYTTVTDVQVPTLVLPDAVTITKNTGKLISKGVEAELMTVPVKGLMMAYSFGYTHATYTELNLSQNGTEVNLKGRRQLFTPDVTSMLSLQYTYTLNQLQVSARGEWKYIGRQYFDLANSIEQSPYNVFNLRVGAESRHIGLYLWSRNITDETYIAYGYDFGGVHLGDPKTYGATLAVKF